MEELIARLTTFAVDVARLCLWLVLLMAIFVPLERLFALHRQRVFRKGFAVDLVYYFLSSLLPNLLLVLPLSVLAWTLHRLIPSEAYAWIGGQPFWFRLTAAMVAGEIGAYWGHRWSHEIPVLWRFHAVHHSAEEVDWLVHTRAHPVDMVFTRLCGLIPVYILGLAQPMGARMDLVPYVITIIGTVWGFFIHANIAWRFGWLEWIISSPGFHHWHHTNDGPELINKNYAPMLPWVDRCFGTLYLPRKQWPAKYGTNEPMAADLGRQLVQPLARVLD